MNGNGRQTMVIFNRWTEVDGVQTQTVHLKDGFRRRTIKKIKMWTEVDGWTDRRKSVRRGLSVMEIAEALFIKISIPPNSWFAAFTADDTCSSFRTSITRGSAFSPALSTFSAAVYMVPGKTKPALAVSVAMTTFASSAATFLAIARPISRDALVIKTVQFLSCPVFDIF